MHTARVRFLNMKKITLSLLCLASLALSAFAQENAAPAADNSGRNVRDRSGKTQTSGDQSNSTPDIKTTAAIRRAVIHNDSLSMMAKNVKIITENGTVTLRGPVKNGAKNENRRARQGSGSGSYDPQRARGESLGIISKPTKRKIERTGKHMSKSQVFCIAKTRTQAETDRAGVANRRLPGGGDLGPAA